MNNTTKRALFLKKFAALVSYAALVGIHFIVTSFDRNAAEQKTLFDEGKSMCDGTRKKSAHQNWLAVDLAVIEHGDIRWDREAYETLGEFWLALGGTWDDSEHGVLDDPYHFEFKI